MDSEGAYFVGDLMRIILSKKKYLVYFNSFEPFWLNYVRLLRSSNDTYKYINPEYYNQKHNIMVLVILYCMFFFHTIIDSKAVRRMCCHSDHVWFFYVCKQLISQKNCSELHSTVFKSILDLVRKSGGSIFDFRWSFIDNWESLRQNCRSYYFRFFFFFLLAFSSII